MDLNKQPYKLAQLMFPMVIRNTVFISHQPKNLWQVLFAAFELGYIQEKIIRLKVFTPHAYQWQR